MALEQRCKRTTVPPFLLTRKKTIKIIRKTSVKRKGRWEEHEVGDYCIQANVQPLKHKELLQFPEADRTTEWIKVYSAEPLRTATQGGEDTRFLADIILWEDKKYKVMKSEHYCMGVLDHYCAYTAREEISAL